MISRTILELLRRENKGSLPVLLRPNTWIFCLEAMIATISKIDGVGGRGWLRRRDMLLGGDFSCYQNSLIVVCLRQKSRNLGIRRMSHDNTMSSMTASTRYTSRCKCSRGQQLQKELDVISFLLIICSPGRKSFLCSCYSFLYRTTGYIIYNQLAQMTNQPRKAVEIRSSRY